MRAQPLLSTSNLPRRFADQGLVSPFGLEAIEAAPVAHGLAARVGALQLHHAVDRLLLLRHTHERWL